MKVLLPTDPFLPVPPVHYGGVERIVAALTDHLRRRGHEVGLIAHPDSTARTDYFVAWPRVAPRSAADHARNALTLLRAALEFQPAVIHSFSRLIYLSPLLAGRTPKIMSYQRPTGGPRTGLAARLGGKSLVFTGCSEFIAAIGRRHGGTWHAIPNFVDCDAYRFSPAVADDAPLVFLSRIEPIKGAHVAIEVAKRIGRRLLIAGNRPQTPEAASYWSTCIAPELGRNRIDYVGPVDNAAKGALLGAAAALIVPIQWDEPFGIVFIEALACGCPVIASPRGALPEIIRDRIEGFLVRDVDEACRAVGDIGLIDRAHCRKRAEETFSAHAVVPRYELLYRAVAAHA
jgi:glycosyltransferase involved in cell wall biosynthesis